ITFAHYEAIVRGGVFGYLENTIIVSAGTVLLCLTLGLLGGYAVARFAFRGRKAFQVLILGLMSIPIASLLIPSFSLLFRIGLLDTRLGLVLLYSAYQLPLVLWLLAGFIDTVPEALEHAALVDGYSRWGILYRITLPLSRPALVAAGLLVLTFAWNDFVVAVVMISSNEVKTLPVGIYDFLGYFGRDWGALTASAMVSAVPVIALFVFFQRYFLSGMTSGGIKG
ncbi:MAG: carbohydrate ABC transporter permease, partial [Terriglobales bacterium]